jgi:hypothetical protein
MRTAVLLLTTLFPACNVFPGGGGGVQEPPRPREDAPDTTWLEEVERPDDLERLIPEAELGVVEALADLESPGFDTFTGASRSLAHAGEPVLPYLGHAARTGSEDARARLGIVSSVVLRRIPSDRLRVYLESPYALLRATTSELVGERHLTEHAGRLVALLDDPETGVRHHAVVALRVLSNRFFGYRAEDPPAKREEAAARWREIWGSG